MRAGKSSGSLWRIEQGNIITGFVNLDKSGEIVSASDEFHEFEITYGGADKNLDYVRTPKGADECTQKASRRSIEILSKMRIRDIDSEMLRISQPCDAV